MLIFLFFLDHNCCLFFLNLDNCFYSICPHQKINLCLEYSKAIISSHLFFYLFIIFSLWFPILEYFLRKKKKTQATFLWKLAWHSQQAVLFLCKCILCPGPSTLDEHSIILAVRMQKQHGPPQKGLNRHSCQEMRKIASCLPVEVYHTPFFFPAFQIKKFNISRAGGEGDGRG